jgi:hypothetical protein
LDWSLYALVYKYAGYTISFSEQMNGSSIAYKRHHDLNDECRRR